MDLKGTIITALAIGCEIAKNGNQNIALGLKKDISEENIQMSKKIVTPTLNEDDNGKIRKILDEDITKIMKKEEDFKEANNNMKEDKEIKIKQETITE